jgi:histone deacetylase 6
MDLTPACYAHFISPLMALAEGKIAAFLEGGYQLDSLSESAAITLKTFLGDPCPLLEQLDEPSER